MTEFARGGGFSVEFFYEKGWPANAGTGLGKTGNREFYREGARAWALNSARRAGSPDIRVGCHDESPADMGHGLHIAGGYVPRSREHRGARHSTRLFSRFERMPGLRLG